MIRYSQQTIDKDDIQNVIKVLRSKFLTTGPNVNFFEKFAAKQINAKFGVAFNSATSALHIACLALGLKKGDMLWTSSNSFVASSNCALYCGASVDFIDIELETYNIDLNLLEKKLFLNKKKKLKLPKIVVPIVFSGNSCDMERLYNLSRKYKFKILEDASHAYGAKYKNSYIGCGKYSDISVFSFHPLKTVTTCEGGLASTKDKSLYEKMSILRNHGIVRSGFLNKRYAKKNNLYYEQQLLGYNYRLNEIEATLGISQVKKKNKFIKLRRNIAKFYDKQLNKNNIQILNEGPNCLSSYHLYVILVKKKNRDDLINYLQKKGIQVSIHYFPIPYHPYYKKIGHKKNYPNSEYYFNNAISIPIYPGLTLSEQKYITKSINSFFE